MRDYFTGLFKPAEWRNQGGGYAWYRQCARCSGYCLDGALSAHARRCEKEAAK